MTTSTLSRIGIPTGVWKIDKAHTRVGFAVKQMGVITTRGEFREFDGGLEIDVRGRAHSRDRRHRDRSRRQGADRPRGEREVSRKAFAMTFAPAIVADKVKIVIDVAAVKKA